MSFNYLYIPGSSLLWLIEILLGFQKGNSLCHCLSKTEMRGAMFLFFFFNFNCVYASLKKFLLWVLRGTIHIEHLLVEVPMKKNPENMISGVTLRGFSPQDFLETLAL